MSASHGHLVYKSFLLLALVFVLGVGARAAEPERSVVQIFLFSQRPLWDLPWRFEPVRRSSGSGFVVEGKRIMTNAHVVSWARQILVRRYQDPQPYLAKVRYIAHDCDLALLEVDDERFFEGLEPLAFGDLPKVRSTVVTYGYPAGGEQISYTRGVVSRIEMQTSVHVGNRQFLSVQTDAAINPGNSGGPVVQDEKVVGVAFMGMPGLENTGFFIPPPVVDHFLADIDDGRYDGFPKAGIRMVPLQNPAYRSYLRLPDDRLGARIDSLLPIPEIAEVLRPDDVVLQVGDYPVGSDGTVMFEGNRVFGSVAFQSVQSGETLPLKIWRDGQALEVSVSMSPYSSDQLLGNQYDVLPRYYIYGGLVFIPLSQDYMKTFGREWRGQANTELVYELYYRRYESPETAREEPVVLSSALAHSVNANMQATYRQLVDRINGVRINKLEDVPEAFAACTNSHHVIEFLPSRVIETIDRRAADAASAEILQTYGIPQDRRL